MDTADLAILALVAVISATALLWWRSRRTAAVQHSSFHIWSVPSSVLQSAGAERFSAERFAAGMGAVRDELSLGQHPLPGDSAATIVTVPQRCSTRVSFAAAGCGLMAQPWKGHAVMGTELADPAMAQPLSGLFLGLSTTGRPVCIYPVPGATVVFTGEQNVVNAVLSSMAWPETAVRITTVDQWEDSWDSAAMRVVITPDPAQLPAEVVTATVALQPASAGLSTVTSHGVELHFTEQSHAMNTRFFR